jgi:hypothetical protein
LGLPLALFWAFEGSHHCPPKSQTEDYERCGIRPGSLIGAFVGGILASAIDGALIAWKPGETKPHTALLPTLSIDRNRSGRSSVTAGLSGVF